MRCPVYFGSDERPLFGWIHFPAAPGRIGLVICSPFGYEAICAHRSLRHIADAAAQAGVPAIRFDYDGTGDSAGDDYDSDRLGSWIASARAAADTLRHYAGIERVCFLGLRLGALIATLAADGRDDVEGLIAMAPVVSGRAHVREFRVLQAALGLGAGVNTSAAGDVQEVVGFALASQTSAAISKVNLAGIASTIRQVLILDRDDLPAAEQWANHLRDGGAEVDLRLLPGYVEMMLDPHNTVVPDRMVRAVSDWIASRQLRGTGAHRVVKTGVARAAPGVAEFPIVCDGGAFGIVAEPNDPARRTARAILLLNAGAVHHVGPNRLWTILARRWAAMGHTTLRLDITGIGDAPQRVGEKENVVYSRRALEDVNASLSYLRGLPGVGECYAMGSCSGAYHAFKAAVAGSWLRGAVVINPLTFFWHEGDSLDTPSYQYAADVQRYSESILQTDKWWKVFRGQTDFRRAAGSLWKYAATVAGSRAREVSRRFGRQSSEDLGAELETIADRKIDLRFVFATGDPGLTLLRSQAGSALHRLDARGKLLITTIDGPDHNFTPLWSQQALTQVLANILDGQPAS